MSTEKENKYELMVFGFIRELDKEFKCDLYHLLPYVIIQIVFKFYPKIMQFELFNAKRFKTLNYKTEIKGLCDVNMIGGCNAYLIYAKCVNNINNEGYNNGVHYWSIKLLNSYKFCHRSIGVTSLRDINLTKRSFEGWHTYSSNICYSYFEGFKDGWFIGDTMSVKLDCNEWTVTYYNNNQKEVQRDLIIPNRAYYFALLLSGRDVSHCRVVDNFNFLSDIS